MIAALLLSRVSLGDGLPARPEQSADDVAAAIAAGQCMESAVTSGAPSTLACDGVVLPLVIWSHLELLAEDSRTCRALYDRAAFRSGAERDALQHRVDWLELELQREREPPPITERAAVRLGVGMAAGAGAVLLGGWSLSLLGGA